MNGKYAWKIRKKIMYIDNQNVLTNEDSLTTIFPLTSSSRGPVTPPICSSDRGIGAEVLTAFVRASCTAFSSTIFPPSFFFLVTQYFLPYERSHKSNILAEDDKPVCFAVTAAVPVAWPLEDDDDDDADPLPVPAFVFDDEEANIVEDDKIVGCALSPPMEIPFVLELVKNSVSTAEF